MASPLSAKATNKLTRATKDIQHPKFQPTYLQPDHPSPLSSDRDTWITPFSAPAYFPLDAFHSALNEMALHPEHSSSLIIRAEQLPDTQEDEDTAFAIHTGVDLIKHQRVRFIPRQPRRDGRLDERVLSYSSTSGDRGVFVQAPVAESAAEIPFYHPPVRKLAFMWESDGNAVDSLEDEASAAPKVYGRISIAYLPFADAMYNVAAIPPAPKIEKKRSPLSGASLSSSSAATAPRPPATVLEEDTPEAREEARKTTERRLQRTCLALLEKLHKHGHGTVQGYVKRVNHDVVVSREPFQDLYQALKERHKHLESRVPKEGSNRIEDVKRHVWKDISIAAFLMLLWRDMYPARAGNNETGMEWDKWGRPPGGFRDLGCGNGLVVHILTSEGYAGKGYELRARRTWPQYPSATQAALVELPIDMPAWFPETMEQWQAGDWPGKEACVVKEGTFLLGNHADELTPWIPLLSLLPETPVPYLNLPCCPHTLDNKFTQFEFVAPPHPHEPQGGFDAGLIAGVSRYKSFTVWLGWVGLMCGWEWEKESLRIPSTRGWAIVARRRWTTPTTTMSPSPKKEGSATEGEETTPAISSATAALAAASVSDSDSAVSKWEANRACREWALEQVNGVRERGEFAIRVKEGKDH